MNRMTTGSTTEADSLYNDLENKSVKELLLCIHEEDKKVVPAVFQAIPQIEKLVEQVYLRMKKRWKAILYRIWHQRTAWDIGCFGNTTHFRGWS